MVHVQDHDFDPSCSCDWCDIGRSIWPIREEDIIPRLEFIIRCMAGSLISILIINKTLLSGFCEI
jgi:hypothetical protein